MTNKLEYRPDIDGLRAIAVIAVIASHLPEKLLSSGFLGVDVFFVISGFVVTGSVMGQRRTQLGQLYIGFLARRVKRLLPALFVCVGVTGAVVLAYDPFPEHSAQTGIAALFGVANFVLYVFELDYFSPSAIYNAFTHMWSLAVEEQFYVVFPLFAWLFFFRTESRSFRPLAVAMIVGGTFSLALFAWLYNSHQPAAFYLMPTRIWELGVGSLIFLARDGRRLTRIRGALNRLSPLVLTALIGCFLVPDALALPTTLVAVTLTALLLAADAGSIAGRLLGQTPVVYTGKVSYSLYLWHWPIIALAPIVLTPEWRSSLVYVAVTVLVAVGSFHLVEQPLRYRTWTGRRLKDIGLAVVCNLLLAALLYLGMVQTTAPSTALHPPAYVPIPHNGRSHVLTCALDGALRRLQASTVDDCTVPARSGMPTIWTMGDSHSGHLQGMLFEAHERIGVGVHLVETPGWPYPFEPGTRFTPREQVFEQISARFRPGDVVVLSRLYLSRTPPYNALDVRTWLGEVDELAASLQQRAVNLVITGPPPLFPFDDVRECELGIDNDDGCSMRRDKLAPQIDAILAQLNGIADAHANVTVLNLFEPVCPSGNEFCHADNGSSFIYRDKDHFNSLGSRSLAGVFIDELRSSAMLAPVE